MANPRKPWRLNVGFLINSTIGIYRDFFFEDLSITSADDLVISAIEGKAKISRTPQGLFVEGDFTGNISLTCVRCLCEYTQTLVWEFDELFAFTRDSITESDLLVPDDAHIDLHSLIYDFAFIEVPIQPLCHPDCQGLCMDCGQNLNEKDCGHHPESDSPFVSLKDLLNKGES